MKAPEKPTYPKGHAGRLLATLAAINKLDRPTAQSVAQLTGLQKGNTDSYVAALNDQYGTRIIKEGSVYRLEDWGRVLKASGVMAYLTAAPNNEPAEQG